MSWSHKITLRPPAHRDYITGYPGIPACNALSVTPSTTDPLVSLPLISRSGAYLSGTVEVRANPKVALKARYLRLELEKVECIPGLASRVKGAKSSGNGLGMGGRALSRIASRSASRAASRNGEREEAEVANSENEETEEVTTGNGGGWMGNLGGAGAKEGTTFIELIGSGPEKLWEPRMDQVKSTVVTTKKSGMFGRKKGKKDSEEPEWEILPDGNYPFRIALPEGLPPSIEVDNRGSGISYRLVATVFGKPKKTLLGSSDPSSGMMRSLAPIFLLKADILPTWPVYSPLLQPPIPSNLPWSTSDTTFVVGDSEESDVHIRGGGLDGREGTGGEVTMKCVREKGAYGPGDEVKVKVEINWDGMRPIKLTRLDFVLREKILYRYPGDDSNGSEAKVVAKSATIFTSNASVSSDPSEPTAFAILYSNEPLSFDLSGIIPSSHSRVSVSTGKYVDVAYHLKIRAMVEGGSEVSVDAWRVIIGGVGSREARGLMSEIGWVDGLCEREGIPSDWDPKGLKSRRLSTQPFGRNDSGGGLAEDRPRPTTQNSTLANLGHEEKSLPAKPVVRKGQQKRPGRARVAVPPVDDSYDSDTMPADSETLPSITPIVLGRGKTRQYESAEAEKDRLYREAKDQSKDHRQQPNPRNDSYNRTNEAEEAATAYTSTAHLTAEQEKARLHSAAIRKRDELQSQLPPERVQLRGNSATSAPFRPQLSPYLGVSNSPDDSQRSHSNINSTGSSTAETEKKRLFLAAKAQAQVRQEEARIELERQNALLAEMEREENIEMTAERTRLQAAENRRREEEQQVREEFEREQAERTRIADANWQKEEARRREVARKQYEEDRIDEDRKYEIEQRRLAEQRRQAEQTRQAESLRSRLVYLAPEGNERGRDTQNAIVAPQAQHPAQIIGGNFSSSPTSSSDPSRSISSYAPNQATTRELEEPLLPPQARSATASSVVRAPSTASFAPTASLDQATTSFYAESIANSAALARNSSRADQKSAYLNSLRQRNDQLRAGVHADQYSPPSRKEAGPPVPRAPSPKHEQRAHHSSQNQGGAYHQSSYDGASGSYDPYSSNSYRAPPTTAPVQTTPSHRQLQPIASNEFSDGPYQPDYASQDTAPTSAPYIVSGVEAQTEYKTAAEEKEEEENRRRQTQTSTGKGKETRPEDDLPTYQTGGNGNPKPYLTAAEEKKELNAYHAAKAAVEAFRSRPAPPPARQQGYASNGYSDSASSVGQQHYESHGQSSPLQSINESPRSLYSAIQEQQSQSTPPRTSSQTISQSAERRARHESSISEESSAELHRDPSIAAGKKAVRSNSGHAASAMPPPLPVQSHSNGYGANPSPYATSEIGGLLRDTIEYEEALEGGH